MKKLISGFLLVCGMATGAPTNDGMYATMQTTMGDVCFELYYTNVPHTAANFVSLAEGARPWIDPRSTFISSEPYYNGTVFHRVIDGFMIQGGSPKGDGTDGPGYTFEDEFDPSLRHDQPGIVSMANSGPDSNGGQFFITVTGAPHLDDVHTVFGRVIEGLVVVSNIAAVTVDGNDKPLADVVITNILITRQGMSALAFAVTNQSSPKVEALPIDIGVNNGVKFSTGTATSSYQYVYGSTNLTDWSEKVSDYWPAPNGDWILTASGESREFFHANRVVYAPDTNMTVNPIGHQLILSIDGNVVKALPTAINSGSAEINGTPDSITYHERRLYPYHVEFYLETSAGYVLFFYLYYTTPASGRCIGYYYSGGWRYIGSGDGGGTFADQDLN